MILEDAEIAAAQKALEAERKRRAEIDARTRPRGLAVCLMDALPKPGEYPCTRFCGAVLALPGLCDECSRREVSEAMAARLKSWSRTLPARQRDVTWEALPRLRSDTGGPRFVLSPGLTLVRARAMLEGSPRAVLLGAAGTGKSTLAAAFLRAALFVDPSARVRWVASADLLRPEVGEDGGPHPLALALSAEVLVLDDLGAELEGAPVGGGILAQRIGPASRVVAERYERGRRTVVTTGFDAEQIARLYGDRVARRLYEGAAVVKLGVGR